MELREKGILITNFIIHYLHYEEIYDYTLNEVLDRAFVLPSKIECNEGVVKVVQELIEKRGLEITVQDVTQKLQNVGLLNGGKKENAHN
ncbi:MAG: hypothetical protein FHOMOCKG_00047 [Methanophagales virus GBV302]|uniref:Uncharacterized protein n=1 Tax=Methanophagales virus GBV302 TaxID=2999281 RepID=A0A9E8V8S4_9CAUD|nr:MAG: hypothetical protein QIT37_gp047 [Methanophagales virus GBV302]WAE39575.1 MAG: hypothetical protein FHOMOCKG_00047 [Methanophagales virus GBV302]